MARGQIVVVLDPEVLREFRAECVRRETTPTKELARLMAQRLEEWRRPGARSGASQASCR